MDQEHFEERLVDRIEPASLDADGVHTYSTASGYVAIDIKQIVASKEPWAYKRMLTYPFPPLLWRIKHLFHPLGRLEKVAVRIVKWIRRW